MSRPLGEHFYVTPNTAHFLDGTFADYRLERFLRYDEGDVEAALGSLQQVVQMRTEMDLWMCLIEEEAEMRSCCATDGEQKLDAAIKIIETDAIALTGSDNHDRPTLHARLKHIPEDCDPPDAVRALVFVLDELESE